MAGTCWTRSPWALEPGEWRPALPLFVNDPFAWVARVDPFVLDEPSQFQTQGPRPLASGAYAKEYDEVKELGAVNSARSPEQEAIAQFYTNNVSPVELFNRTFRDISASEGLTMVEEARLFGMLNLATADSLINCWSDKDSFGFWRPITAIREGDNDGNRFTVGDPDWLPLQPTPPYPDHTSGYNCVTGAMMHTGKAFFGTNDMSFDVVRPNVLTVAKVTRHYEQFTAVVDDTITPACSKDSTSAPPTSREHGSAGTSPAWCPRISSVLCADSVQEIAQRIVRVMASPAPRTTVASAIGSHGSRSGQRAQRGRSDTAAPAISR